MCVCLCVCVCVCVCECACVCACVCMHVYDRENQWGSYLSPMSDAKGTGWNTKHRGLLYTKLLHRKVVIKTIELTQQPLPGTGGQCATHRRHRVLPSHQLCLPIRTHAANACGQPHLCHGDRPLQGQCHRRKQHQGACRWWCVARRLHTRQTVPTSLIHKHNLHVRVQRRHVDSHRPLQLAHTQIHTHIHTQMKTSHIRGTDTTLHATHAGHRHTHVPNTKVSHKGCSQH